MEKIKIGKNRTGIATSPLDSKSQREEAQSRPIPPGGPEDLLRAREAYLQASEPLGTLPPPAQLKGLLSSAKQKLTGKRPEILLDKLGERAAFERTGTRLYDGLIMKAEFNGFADEEFVMKTLHQFRNEELKHMTIICKAIEELGADPTAITPCADTSGVIAEGLIKVITDPRTSFTQSLGAIFVAELADNASWELLISLTDQFGFQDMTSEFRMALQEEANHLVEVKNLLQQLTFSEAKLLSAA